MNEWIAAMIILVGIALSSAAARRAGRMKSSVGLVLAIMMLPMMLHYQLIITPDSTDAWLSTAVFIGLCVWYGSKNQTWLAPVSTVVVVQFNLVTYGVITTIIVMVAAILLALFAAFVIFAGTDHTKDYDGK